MPRSANDIHHMHPSSDGTALGATSYRDFETLTGLVATLERGVYFHVRAGRERRRGLDTRDARPHSANMLQMRCAWE